MLCTSNMNAILYLLLFLCLSNLHIEVDSLTQVRKGLGRVTWALLPNASQSQSDVIVLTARSTIASLSIDNGTIFWRLLYPISQNPVHPLAVVSNGEVIVVQFSDNRIRSCHRNGSILWEISSCELESLNSDTVLYRSCDTGEIVYTDLMSGVALSLGEGTKISSTSLEKLNTHGFGRRTWHMKNITLSSEDDGRFQALQNDEVLWSLEEGLAHPLDVALYPFENSPVLVLLSELSFVAGLNVTGSLNLLWKKPIRGKCRLVHGHAEVAVVVCVEGKHSRVVAMNPVLGKEVFEKTYEDFAVQRAAIHKTCETNLCVHLSDTMGRIEFAYTEGTFLSDGHMIRIHYEPNGSELSAFVAESAIWKINVAHGSKIVKIISGERHPFENSVSLPSVRITGDRRVLFKYAFQDVLLVLSFDAAKECVHSMLIDGRSGEIYEVFEHPRSRPMSLGAKGENWFLYTTWNTDLLTTEVHIADMYQQQGLHTSWVRKLLRDVLAKYWTSFSDLTLVQQKAQESEEQFCDLTCSADREPSASGSRNRPYVVRSSMVLTHVPVGMAVTKTKLGVSEQSILFVLDSGALALVSKSTVDARRPKNMNPAYASEYLRRYVPSLSLQSTSHDNKYIDVNGIQSVGIQSVFCAPDMSRESSSHIVSAGLDLLLTQVHPIGKFDFLDSDFNFFAVLLTIIMLLFSYLYSERLVRKTSLSRSW